MPTKDDLNDALDALERGELRGAFAALTSAWRGCPHPRIGALLTATGDRLCEAAGPVPLKKGRSKKAQTLWMEAAAERRPEALRSLVELMGTATAKMAVERLEALEGWDDPRLPALLLQVMAAPPWRYEGAMPFWRRCLKRIGQADDPGLAPRLEALGGRYLAVIPNYVGERVQERIEELAAAMRNRLGGAAPTLDEAAAAACETLEAKLVVELSTERGETEQGPSTEELLAAVHTDPAADGPRAVLADRLLERGDPLGELISLQLARAGGRSDPGSRARERVLVMDHGDAWLGQINAVLKQKVFHRGFLAYAQLWRTPAALPKVADDPAWATVETFDLAGREWPTGKVRDVLLAIVSAQPALRALVGIPAVALARLDAAVLARIERLQVQVPGDQDDPSPKAARSLLPWLDAADGPRERHVGVFSRPRCRLVPAQLAPVLAAPAFARHVRALTVGTSRYGRIAPSAGLRAWVDALEPTPLQRLSFDVWLGASSCWFHLERGQVGGRLDRVTVADDSRWHMGEEPLFAVRAVGALLEELGREVHLCVDVRKIFLPGVRGTKCRAVPSTDDLAALRTCCVGEPVLLEGDWCPGAAIWAEP